MLSLTKDGWLESPGSPSVERFPTVRTMPLQNALWPLGVVWHWTAHIRNREKTKGSPRALAQSIQKYDGGPKRGGKDVPASWHLLVTYEGDILQSAPLNVGTWHVGKSGKVGGHFFSNVNRATVGIELENSGGLKRLGGRLYAWPFYKNPLAVPSQRTPAPWLEIPEGSALEAEGALYENFTVEQIETAFALVKLFSERFGWSRDQLSMGHVDFDYPRKLDPGPLWMRRYLPQIICRAFDPRPTGSDPQVSPPSSR